jgi:hypothetical protein
MPTLQRTATPTLKRVETYLEFTLTERAALNNGIRSFEHRANNTLVKCYGDPERLTSVQLSQVLGKNSPEEHAQYFLRMLSNVVAALYGRDEYDYVQQQYTRLILKHGGAFDLHGDRVEVKFIAEQTSGIGILTIFFES